MHPETHGAPEVISPVVALPDVARRARPQRYLTPPVWSAGA